MWRDWSNHERGESEFFEVVMERVRTFLAWQEQADFLLQPLRKSKFFKDLFRCPQSSDVHAEGPVVESHLDLMLRVLLATVGNSVHLGDIEEFRRLKGFAGELDEVEEILKEKVASFETFIICHDLGKPEVVRFEAREGSGGLDLAFNDFKKQARESEKKERDMAISRYEKEYKKFAAAMSDSSSREIQDTFFLNYQIAISYPGYAHQIAKPELRELLVKESKKRKLTPDDTEDVFHAILLQEKVLRDFSAGPNLSAYNHLIAYSVKYGRDPDDFLDFLLAVIFLEICSAPCRGVHGVYYELSPFINFLLSEQEAVPGKRADRLKQQLDKQLKIERAKFQQVGLDGNDLMKLLGMKPGPEFGQTLAVVHAWAKNETPMPSVPVEVRGELSKRVQKFRAK